MKIVSTFLWPGTPTPVFVTDTGDVWMYTTAESNGLNVKRFPLIDGATGQPIIPSTHPPLAPGDNIVVLYTKKEALVWRPHVVEYIGTTSFQFRDVDRALATGLYIDEGKHWRRA